MSVERFSFSAALSHWSNVEGPKGFIWKYALAYVLIALGLLLIVGVFFVVAVMSLTDLDPTSDPHEIWTALLLFALLVLLVLIFGLLYWTMFEAASQRRYVRQEGFSLRLGADEGRVFVVGLLWVLTLIALNVAGSIVVGLIGVGLIRAIGFSAILIVGLLVIAFAGFLIWFMVRLAPASAMSIRDRQIRFTSAFGAKKRQFWSLFSAYFVMAFIFIAIIVSFCLIFIALLAGAIFSSIDFSAGEPDPEELVTVFLNPLLIGLSVLWGIGAYFVTGVMWFAWSGIPAKAALTDPNWEGSVNAAETFS